jgi:hypothetical protein
MLLVVLTSRLERREREAIAYLIEENRLLRRQLGGRRLRFTDGSRRRLAVRMAGENPTWGYMRIQGALKNVGHRVGRSTIARILKGAGVLPVPERPTSWQTFLRAHWGAIAGADFFTTVVWTWRGHVTFYTVFVIDLASRRVQIVGSTPHLRRRPPSSARFVGVRGSAAYSTITSARRDQPAERWDITGSDESSPIGHKAARCTFSRLRRA